MNCRHCGDYVKSRFLDLGFAPPSNAYLAKRQLSEPEIYYPLCVRVCESCWLVQTEDYTDSASLFTPNYAYFSGTSKTWVEHTRRYATSVTERFLLNSKSHVMELACNDGHLLENFLKSGIPCLGVEPTESTARQARNLGVPVIQEFFGESLAREIVSNYGVFDLIIGNNVYAHVPDINDFTGAMKFCLGDQGVITLEFPHLLNLMKYMQFDTVYHEHFSYLSLSSVSNIFRAHGLRIFDVDELDTHGGSLRVYGCHEKGPYTLQESVGRIISVEDEFGLTAAPIFLEFQEKVNQVKDQFLQFLLGARKAQKKVVGYGAAAKGNTLLNYAGVKPDLISAVADAAPAKQGMFLPGSHIPVVNPNTIEEIRPDYIVILPWNIREEIIDELQFVRKWGAKFVTAIPQLDIF
jgi:hypothetical protein